MGERSATTTNSEDAKRFLDKDYWLARLAELKDSLMTGEISEAIYQSKVRQLKTRARQRGIEL